MMIAVSCSGDAPEGSVKLGKIGVNGRKYREIEAAKEWKLSDKFTIEQHNNPKHSAAGYIKDYCSYIKISHDMTIKHTAKFVSQHEQTRRNIQRGMKSFL